MAMKWISSRECHWMMNDFNILAHLLVLYFCTIPTHNVGLALFQFWAIAVNTSECCIKIHKEKDRI